MRLGPPLGVDLDVRQLLERVVLLKTYCSLLLLRSLEHPLDKLNRMLHRLDTPDVDVRDMIASYLGKALKELLNNVSDAG